MALSYSGIWRAGNDPYYLWGNASWDSFSTKWAKLSASNQRLVDFDIATDGGRQIWTGVWRAGNDGHYLWANADWNNFNAKWQALSAQGLRLTTLRTYDGRWAGVWRAGNDGHYLWVNANWQSFNAKWTELSAANLRLVDIETYEVGGKRLWAGVWRAGTGGHYLWANADWANFRAKWVELANAGLRLTRIKQYKIDGQSRYAGVWRPGTDGYYLWMNASWDSFVAKWQELAAANLRLVHLHVDPIGTVPTVRMHVKVLTQPTIPLATMITRMREIYESVGIRLEVASTENLNLPALNDCDVGECVRGTTTAEQNQLFANRNNVGANEVVAYLIRSTVPPANGCAAHPAGRPGAVVVQGATQWTLAHEIGHVLGLRHCDAPGARLFDRLMTGGGTGNITNPPPDLNATELGTMRSSALTIDL